MKFFGDDGQHKDQLIRCWQQSMTRAPESRSGNFLSSIADDKSLSWEHF